jgi:hypothetical protein
LHGYGELVTKAMSAIAAKVSKDEGYDLCLSRPKHQFPSANVVRFLSVSLATRKVLDVLLNAFQGAKVANVRFSDYIDPSTATKNFHVQEGYVWQPFESGTWYADSQDKEDLAEDSVVETDDLEVAAEVADGRDSRVSSPTRFRVARADASIGTIRKKIEEVFGLPEGSVALCGPDKKGLRGDATIATLRKRWE